MIKVSDIDQDREHADVPGDWHFKVSPLDTRLMERFQAVVTPGSKVSYDEMMLPFCGRSPHVTKVPGKPHPNGFKVWTLADHGYMYDWLYFSGSAGMLLRWLFVVVSEMQNIAIIFFGVLVQEPRESRDVRYTYLGAILGF